jgi:hypothetical protein
MLRVPRDVDRFPIRHLNQKPAGIRAVIGTNRSLDLSGHKDLLKEITNTNEINKVTSPLPNPPPFEGEGRVGGKIN